MSLVSAEHKTGLILLVVALLVVGCGNGERDEQPEGGDTANVVRLPDRSPKPAPPRTVTTDRFASGVPRAPKVRPAPPAPNTFEALAMASIPAVVGVHNLASSVGRPTGLPPGALRDQAADVRARLVLLGSQLRRSPGAARAELAAIVNGYAGVASRVARRERPLVTRERRRLAAMDLRWRRALRDIGRRSRSDIVASVPPLPRPHIPAPGHRARGAR